MRVLAIRRIWFYFILFVLYWKKKQDKLHCFYSKSLGFVFSLYIFIKKMLLWSVPPVTPPHTGCFWAVPSSQGHCWWQPAGFDHSHSESDFHKIDEESYCCSLSYQMRTEGKGEDGSWGNRATIKGCVVLSLPLRCCNFQRRLPRALLNDGVSIL